MIENIKKFQEEFKAKYGVKADIQIYVHDAAEYKASNKIVTELSNELESKILRDQDGEGVFSWISTENKDEKIKVISFCDKPTDWNADFLEELSDDAFRGLTKLTTTDNSEAGQGELVRAYLNTHWERLEREPTFEQVCDITEVNQDIARKVYDEFMNEFKLEEEKAV